MSADAGRRGGRWRSDEVSRFAHAAFVFTGGLVVVQERRGESNEGQRLCAGRKGGAQNESETVCRARACRGRWQGKRGQETTLLATSTTVHALSTQPIRRASRRADAYIDHLPGRRSTDVTRPKKHRNQRGHDRRRDAKRRRQTTTTDPGGGGGARSSNARPHPPQQRARLLGRARERDAPAVHVRHAVGVRQLLEPVRHPHGRHAAG